MKVLESLVIIFIISSNTAVFSQHWIPDLGDGTYQNPIIYADYSDPDVIRVGDDFYMTASSFNCFPALPILHSNDLINWEIINHAVDIFPNKDFNIPQHGNGIWAPSLRYHQSEFWIYYGDPDRGIYMVKTEDIRTKWNPPILVKEASGWIDPCPLWDDDGNAYLVHAFARSRAGINSILHVNKLSSDGTRVLDEGTLVFDGHDKHPTIEGPKFYKRNGYYYIFAPAGGVRPGWQTVLRSKNIYGPYEDKIVLAQGNTNINGPHQGGYIELENGEGWFIHFQDREAYGRIIHLQPVVWKDDWPVIGHDVDGDGTGEPVLVFKKPEVGMTYPILVPQTSDEFDLQKLSLQWQWQANYQTSWFSLTEKEGSLRLYSQPLPNDSLNLWHAPNLLLQKFPALQFIVTTKITFYGNIYNEKAGLIVMGQDYAYLALQKVKNGVNLVQVICSGANDGGEERIVEQVPIDNQSLYLRITIESDALCHFFYSLDEKNYQLIGESFMAKAGKWIGAKVGLFGVQPNISKIGGYADFDFFRIE